MSKLAISSDWQLHNNNLDKVDLFANQLLSHCIKHKIKTFIHLGDLKHQYSPVDIKAIIYAVKLIKRFKKYGIEWIQLLGNHDRSSMNDDSINWMGILRAVGATTITAPQLITASSVRLAMVPYMSDGSALTDAFKHVADSADLLLFHNTIKNCKVNVLHSLNEGVGLEDLHLRRYKYAIGGHIHLPQELASNCFFVGSPFCQDWGEANQQKRFLVYDTYDSKFTSVRSTVPGMYDTSWPDFPKKSFGIFNNSKVRIHVPCNESIDIAKSLLKAKTHAESLYPEAEITTVAEFSDKDGGIKNISTTDDEVALKDFINSSCPKHLEKYKRKLFSYLKFKLSENGYLRRASQTIEFTEAEGKNFLCYKKIKVDFTNKGIIVVSGKNKDWPNRSNGTGKTSFLQLLKVAITGSTLKGQANDKWVRRNSSGSAWVKLRLKLQDRRKCLISRVRRPVKLNLLINGKDRSTGIGTRGTQAAIEALTGLTEETIKNAIYIDQTETNEILKGSDTDRKKIFAKLLNLERFDLAKELLKDELKKTTKLKIEVESDIDHLRKDIRSYKDIAEDISTEKEYKAALKEYTGSRLIFSNLKRHIKRYEKLKNKKLKKNVILEDSIHPQIQSILNRIEINIELRGAYKKELEAFENVTNVCPNCRQEISDEWRKKRMQMLIKGLSFIKDKIDKLDKKRKPLDLTLRKAEDDLYTIDNKLSRYRVKLDSLQDKVADSKKIFQQYKAKEKVRYKYITLLKKKKLKLKALIKMSDALSMDIGFISYGITVFSKDGLPAYLINTLCPALNVAAAKYSRLISEDEIRVKFKIDDDGAIYPKIKNAHGGEFIDDQSQGETRLASMITSFAVRDVINPANLLILDEPGDGLDQHNALIFAQVLKEVSKRFGLILITTHNPIILSVLENEKHIYIQKKNKIARVVKYE